MSARTVVVHGHFYQPPRENPWLEVVPPERSAAPFHDWNERITAECYAPNASARRLDAAGRVLEIVSNYRRMSFNVGPTLFSYLRSTHPALDVAIRAADADSCARLDGHGNAIAQAYNHMILPLATPRDRRTQVLWGLADFRHRFGRDAEGMWLPETAVDLPTLESLAEAGVAFTVLAPHQAFRWRRLPAPGSDVPGEWQGVGPGGIDPRRPYLARLPSGRSIAIFFYDSEVSHAVAFDGVLGSGDRFAQRLVDRFSAEGGPQVVSIATDGESYGHHHRFGEMALAAAIERLDALGVEVASYGAFLARHPPEYEVEIAERTSWSCAHGVERWRSDCGCRIGPPSDGWNQAWRSGLRTALDWLASEIDRRFEEEGGRLVPDPWVLRDAFGEVLVDPARRGLRAFLDRAAGRPLADAEAARLARGLEAQRNRLFMFTSCGWFFDDIAGLEGRQVLLYAARALDLCHDESGALREGFLERLATARSNRPETGNGADLFRDEILPRAIDCRRIAVAAVIERLVGTTAPGTHLVLPGAAHLDARIETHLDTGEPDETSVDRVVVASAEIHCAHVLGAQRFLVGATRAGLFDVVACARAIEAADSRIDPAAVTAALRAAFERGASGRVIAGLLRELGPESFGLDVLDTVSRSRMFPAIAASAERTVDRHLRRLVPLARAVALEAADGGYPVPARIQAVLLTDPAEPRAESDLAAAQEAVLDLVEAMAGARRAAAGAPGAEASTGARGAARAIAGQAIGRAIARVEEMRARAAPPFSRDRLEVLAETASRPSLESARLQPLQTLLWWAVLSRAGSDLRADAELGALCTVLGFAPEARVLAERSAAFGQRLWSMETA